MSEQCSSITCSNEATMTLDLFLEWKNDPPYSFEQSVPYCDNDIGWFYRSFSRDSYEHATVKGITILKPL